MNRLKFLRKKKGYTQAQIGKLLNITSQGYGKYEIGTSDIDINSLIKLADFYNVSLDYIAGRTDYSCYKKFNNKNSILITNRDGTQIEITNEEDKKFIEQFLEIKKLTNNQRNKNTYNHSINITNTTNNGNINF